MKTPTDDIFQLIHSMTAAEKRYFKIHFSSEKSLITELFNFLNSMKSYDEEEVKRHFINSKLSKNLKVYKIMLSDLLLKSLSSFRYKKSINSIIKQSLEEVEILAEKRLYPQALKRLQKIKQLCYQHEEFDQLIYITNLEYQFKNFYELPVDEGDLNLLDEIISSSEKVSKIFELKKLNHELNLDAGKLTSKKITKEELKSYESTLKNNLKDKSFLKKQYYSITALGNIHHCLKDAKKEYYYRTRAIEFLNNYKHLIESNPHKYWESYFNLAASCLRSNRFDEFKEAVISLKSFTKKHPSFIRKNILIYVLELACYRYQKKFDKIINELEPELLKQIDSYGIEEERSIVFSYTSLMMTHLSVENHTEVQFYLRRLLKYSSAGETFNYFFETVNLISHYESGDFDILQSILTSKKRKIKRRPDYGSPFFKEILDFFSQLVDPKNDLRKNIAQLKKKRKLYSEDNYIGLLDYFLFDDWMKALLDGKTYSKYINS